MTANAFFQQYWPIIAVVLAMVALLVVVLRRGRGQRVTLTEQDSSTRTLARPEAAPPAAPAPQLTDSELTRLKGVGPKLAAALDAQGFGSLQKLAALDDMAQVALDGKLGTFAGRVQRDRLAEQARLLTSDPAGYEAAFGKGA